MLPRLCVLPLLALLLPLSPSAAAAPLAEVDVPGRLPGDVAVVAVQEAFVPLPCGGSVAVRGDGSVAVYLPSPCPDPVEDALREACRWGDPESTCCTFVGPACLVAVADAAARQAWAQTGLDEVPILSDLCRDQPHPPPACCAAPDSRCAVGLMIGIQRRVGSTVGIPFCITLTVPDQGVPTAHADLERACGEPPPQGGTGDEDPRPDPDQD